MLQHGTMVIKVIGFAQIDAYFCKDAPKTIFTFRPQ